MNKDYSLLETKMNVNRRIVLTRFPQKIQKKNLGKIKQRYREIKKKSPLEGIREKLN